MFGDYVLVLRMTVYVFESASQRLEKNWVFNFY